MTHIKLTKRNISFNENPVASDSHGNKTYFCYASISSTQKQLEKILESGCLPETAEITGKNGMKFKIATYQGDGFWFESEIKDSKKWRLWTPFKDETNLKKIAKNAKKKA